ncbi:cytosine permease [Streptomyces laculatispora]|uniref:cytosine permease n=1 Tax=Streptomyces laculatispora TaxID=887464 RepID=UPI0035126222
MAAIRPRASASAFCERQQRRADALLDGPRPGRDPAPPATRARATLVVAGVATAFVFLGHFVWNAQSAMTSFVLLLTAIGTPWAVITMISHLRCRGTYDAKALQVCNRGTRGGVCRFRAGWQPHATFGWALGAAVGLCGVSTPLHEGPLLALTGGVDCSFVLSGLVGGVTYTVLTRRAPRGAAGRARGQARPAAQHTP